MWVLKRHSGRSITDQPSIQMNATALNLPRTVRRLNQHHMETCAGFYGSRIGGRYFRARAVDGKLQVFDFETWRTVEPADIKFHDHNGRDISL